MTDAKNMRGYLNLFEAEDTSYVGKMDNPSISYSAEMKGGEITKVTAFLKSYESGRYTKLGRNLLEVEQLEKRVKELKEETKQEARELVADLFHAEDAACTRVVDTVSFVFQMSKDPKATETVKYSKVLDELETHLTPDLLEVMKTLVAKHTSAPVQKAASLKATDKAAQTEESIHEGIGDKLTGFFAKLKNWVNQWGASYDAKLDALKSQVGLSEALVVEDNGLADGSLVKINAPESSAHGEYGHINGEEDGMIKVSIYGTGFYGLYTTDQLTPASPEEVGR